MTDQEKRALAKIISDVDEGIAFLASIKRRVALLLSPIPSLPTISLKDPRTGKSHNISLQSGTGACRKSSDPGPRPEG